MPRRFSKYPSLGILETLERWSFGGVPRDAFKQDIIKSKTAPNKKALSQKLYALRKCGLMKYKGAKAVITEKGYKYINFARLDELKIENKKKDGFWRLIIFDIPEEKKAARELLRNKLNEFECYQLQKSVYVTCFICEKEIAELVKLLAISKHVCVVKANSLGNKEAMVARYFG